MCNQGLRYFPHTGYLGLTPVRVEGIVRTKLDSDERLLQATSLTISIRCYESRIGRVNVLHSNVLVDHTQVLWSKSEDVEHEPIGNLDYPFRLTLPAKIGGFSTTVFVDYRCMWRVEAVLNHAYIPGVGSRQVKHFELPLVRYDLPTHIPLSPLPDPYLSQITNKPRAPRIRYSVDTPTNAIGPTDLVSVPIHLQPTDHAVSIRSASVIVERRIQLFENSNATPPQPSPTTPFINSSSRSSSPTHSDSPASASTASVFSHPQTAQHIDTLQINPQASVSFSSLNSSNPTLTPNSVFLSSTSVASSTRPLLPPTTPPPPTNASTSSLHAKLITNTIAEAETSGRFVRDENGVWNKTMTLQWPVAKSHSRWAVGESILSDLASVRYFVRVKVAVQSPSGSDTLELNEKEIFVVSTNNAERQLAITRYNELLDLAHQEYRSKSKSPRRTRVDREELPPSPLPSADTISKASAAHMPGTIGHGSGSSKSRSARRPHTSAGPRDKPLGSSPTRLDASSFGGRARDACTTVEPRGELYKKRRSSRLEEVTSGRLLRPDSSHTVETKRSGRSYFFSSSAPKMGSVPSGSSTSTTSSSSMSSSSHAGSESDRMREWEAELAKIEMRSRRSSDLLGFAKFLRKRPSTTVTPRVMLPGCDAS
ncbi:hypothetical protein D9756_001895 [Leucocoprinus leucothites]|uniref:Uncharacterized protein n=1 Tax=Leucocoprinus leucothites TaxID=201217 RepID=A0A8H5LI78_9AGAR|nr:hypothetical protein D9756_001895 [Leucoagaricus leucothites]